MSLPHPRRLLAALAVAVLCVLSACGGGDSPGGGTSGDVASDGEQETSATGTSDEAVAPARGEGCVPPPDLPTQIPTFDSTPDQGLVEGRSLQATLTTTCGPVVIELLGEQAPQSVASFEFLATQDYWADSPCHRLTTEGLYVLQCGDPTGTGRGGPGYTFGIENAPEDGQYPAGTLAMARTMEPDSNGGQFFIVYEDTELPVEGGGYSVFGRVVEGMEIIERVAEAGVDGGGADGMPAQPISILDVGVTEQKG